MAKIGWVSGSGRGMKMKVGNTGAIVAGNMVTVDGAGNQYIMAAAAAETQIIGVAGEAVAAPTADGDVEVFVYTDRNDRFRQDVITGTIAATDVNRVCDSAVAGIDVSASAVDNIQIVEVDVANAQAIVIIDFNAGSAGVV